MGSYTVLGVDKDTRKDRVVVVDAETEDGAAESAMESGLVEIKGVRSFNAPATRVDDRPAWTPKRPRDVADQVERGVFAGGAKLVVCVTWIVLAASLVASTTGGIVLVSACMGTVAFGLVMLIDRLRK